MVTVSPFVALRPEGDVVARTVDGALNSAQRVGRRDAHPRSIAWLEAWGGEDLADVDEWVADGSLLVDDVPSLRLVEQTTVGGMRTLGLLGVVRIDELVPHERTDPAAVARRAARDRRQQVDHRPLLSVLAADPPGLDALLAAAMAEPPEVDVVDETGATHRVWVCDEVTTAGLVEAVRPVPCLLADGHHRVAAARVLGRDESLSLVSFAAHAPKLLPVWRVAAVPRGTDEAIAGWLNALPRGDAVDVHALGWRVDVAGRDGELPVETSQRLAESVPSVARVTTTADPTTAAVAERDGAVLVGARPPTVAEVLAAVAAGRPLPPKSTAFTPKPRVGLALRRA